MKLLYIASHPWLERNDLLIFNSLGFDVFSTGAFQQPNKPSFEYVRSLHWEANCELLDLFKVENPNYKLKDRNLQLTLTKEFIDKFDIVVISWQFKYLHRYWDLLKDKLVIFQTMGQSDLPRERSLKPYRAKGVKLVRIAETEQNFPKFAGADAVIDLSVDTSVYKPWVGDDLSILTVNQMIWRRRECNVVPYLQATEGFSRKLYGVGNESLKTDFNLGPISPEKLVEEYSRSRLCFSLGTKPAPITMGFKEAMSAGCPVITWGPVLGGAFNEACTYMAYRYIENGVNGYYSDDIGEMRKFINKLLKDEDHAKAISVQSQITAKKNFSIEAIRERWKEFFNILSVEVFSKES